MFFRYITFFLNFLLVLFIEGDRALTAIDEDNVNQVNSGEWLLVLCSKRESDCLNLKGVLHRMPITSSVSLGFGDLSTDTPLRVRMSAFEPLTLYHVLDGEFRKLDSKQDVFTLSEIMRLRLWSEIPPLKFWAHPTSKLTNFYMYLYKAEEKLLRSGRVGWAFTGLLATVLVVTKLLWRQVPSILNYLKRVGKPGPGSSLPIQTQMASLPHIIAE
nr:uncharacterized protein LOC108073825 [Drosophila kikkawai]